MIRNRTKHTYQLLPVSLLNTEFAEGIATVFLYRMVTERCCWNRLEMETLLVTPLALGFLRCGVSSFRFSALYSLHILPAMTAKWS